MPLYSDPIYSFFSDTSFGQLPDNVVHQAKRCLWDLIATAVAGSETPLHSVIMRFATRHFVGSEHFRAQSLLGSGPLSPIGAALVGATCIDSVDCHDGHRKTKGHVGCAVLPSLISVAEATANDLSGKELLRLLTIGYEIGTRCGIALHNSVADYHTSGAWNAITCAALSSHLLGLDQSRTEHALGIAEYHGPRSQMMRNIDYPTMLKDGSGWGAMAGVSAAYLAQDGFTGAPAISVVGDDVASTWEDLGSRFEILQQYFKAYPVCRWAQPAIAAVLELRSSFEFDYTQISQIDITSFHEASRLFDGIPTDTEQAQYAISFPIAAALIRGTITTEEILESGLSDPDLLNLTNRINLHESDEFNAKFPAERWAKVGITLDNGEVLQSPPCEARGDPNNPLSDTELVEKYHALTRTVWETKKSELVLSVVQNMENHRLSELLEAIRS